MQQNNLLTEIIMGVLAALLIIAGGLLRYFGTIDTEVMLSMIGGALALFSVNLAYKAPSPAQHAALLQLASQALQTKPPQPAQLVQAPALASVPDVASSYPWNALTPAPVAALPLVQVPFNPASSAAATPQANFTTSYNPPTSAPAQKMPFSNTVTAQTAGMASMPQAIQTTMANLPAAPKQQ